MLSVLDVSKRELFMSVEDKALIPNLCMPGADKLAARIKECLLEKPTTSTVILGSSAHSQSSRPAKPVYTASVQQKMKTRAAHDVMTKHIAHVAELAVAHQQKLIERRKLVIEMANRMSSPHHAGRPDPSGSLGSLGSLGRSASFGLEDLESSEDELDDVQDAISISSGGPTPAGSNKPKAHNSVPAQAPTSTTAATALHDKVKSPAPPASSASSSGSSGKTGTSATAASATAGSTAAASNSRRNILPPTMGNMGTMGTAVTALVPPAPPSKVILMSKQPLAGNNSEEFLNRFILTQVRAVISFCFVFKVGIFSSCHGRSPLCCSRGF